MKSIKKTNYAEQAEQDVTAEPIEQNEQKITEILVSKSHQLL